MDLIKIYSNNSKKYRGELFNILEYKLRIFFNYCEKVGLLEVYLITIYLIILKDKALDFYYSHLISKGYSFTMLINRTKQHFKMDFNR